jgi:uncharacterized membrane protein YvlD (DUF360 family)
MRGALRRLVAFYALQLRLLRTWRLGRKALLTRVLLTTAVSYLALAIAIWAVPGISAAGAPSVVGAVVLIAALNSLLRPILLWLAMPVGIIAVVCLGTALQFVVIVLVGVLVPGIRLAGLDAAIETALIFAVLNASISWFIALGEDESYFSHLVRLLIRQDATTSTTPGLVIIQIDGLSRPLLQGQIRAGRVPTMARWVRTSSHRLVGWECQLPSQTSASQAGILLGSNDGIPAFRWYEKPTGRLLVSNRPADATEIEARLSTGHGLLAIDGFGVGNLFSGDAPDTVLTMSRFHGYTTPIGPTRSWFYFFVSPFAFSRAVLLTIGEAVKEYWQARRQRVAGIEPRIERGGSYPFLRGVTNVFLRQVTTAMVVERMLRGTPVIYADYVDYDEIAHHAGPERGESLDALDGVDHVLGALQRVAEEAPRPYQFVVLSDHGQSQGATFRQRFGVTLEQLIRTLIGPEAELRTATSTAEPWGPVNALFTEVGRVAGLGGRLVRGTFASRSTGGSVELGPGRDEHGSAAIPDRGQRPGLVVCVSGNLALIYLNDSPLRLTLEELETLHPRLVSGLTSHQGIGFALIRSAARGAVAIGAAGRHYLDDGSIEGQDPLAPFGPLAAEDLRRLDSMPNIGDIVLNSWLDPATDEVAAFEELVGSHGGLGGWQTNAFLLFPSAWGIVDGPIVGAPAVHRQLVGWLTATGLR